MCRWLSEEFENEGGKTCRGMDMDKRQLTGPNNDSLFDRVVIILERARSDVARSFNSEMVLAYWLIGPEIVQELQRGEDRAEYGQQLIEDLSKRLN
jgi:hypothetical protein